MASPSDPNLSPKQLDLLRVLWNLGRATLREVHERVADRYEYTTIQTMLDRMVEKGLVTRNRNTRPARYQAKYSQKQAMRHYLGLLLEKVTDGPGPVVLQLLKDERFSAEELTAIRQMIEEAEQKETS